MKVLLFLLLPFVVCSQSVEAKFKYIQYSTDQSTKPHYEINVVFSVDGIGIFNDQGLYMEFLRTEQNKVFEYDGELWRMGKDQLSWYLDRINELNTKPRKRWVFPHKAYIPKSSKLRT